MAESDTAQERNERATPKRLHDAREKGQIARSRELSTMLILLAGAATLYASAGYMLRGFGGLMASSLELPRTAAFAADAVPRRAIEVMLDALLALAPMLVMATLVALAAPLALGGWNFSGEALLPKLERLDPLKGFKRVLGPKGLMESVKALAKFILILGFLLLALRWRQAEILALGRADIGAGLAASADILFSTFLVACAATVILALVDVPFQLWQHQRGLRMSRQELRDELKETDGSPELKGRIRALQHEVARRRMMEEVRKADVVVTNPEHYAVALRFDPKSMRAPLVVAKGVEHIALNIRAVAAAHDVTVMEAPPLARALYHTTKLNREIPAGLYVAVARVLAYVFQLRAGATDPALPRDLPIPTELVY